MSGVQGILTNVPVDYPDYLRDESRKAGCADSISFPTTEAMIREQMAWASQRGMAVTVQGARTGITAGAVADGGHILNLSRMNRITGLGRDGDRQTFRVTAQPGVVLSELRAALRERKFDTSGWTDDARDACDELRASGDFFLPPDPTETSASLGGMVACNASGACSYHYGATRRYVEGLRVVLADGDVLSLRRGEAGARGRRFSLMSSGGRTLAGAVPSYAMPRVKNAAGYFAANDMDLIDLFIGSEGTLGVITEIDLRLAPLPRVLWGVMAFFPEEEQAVSFVREIRSHPGASGAAAAAESRRAILAAVEFFDRGALAMLRRQKASNPAFAELPAIPDGEPTAIYVEYHGETEPTVEDAVAKMAETMAACGGREDATWLASDSPTLERLKAFRHAVPECVNLLIDERRKREPGLTKLGTDLAVPDEHLEAAMALYREGLGRLKLDAVIFGHIGNNHVHVNILPKSMEEYRQGKDLYLEWAARVVAMGGTVSAEHGIGKLKTALLREMYGEAGIGEMRAVKRVFDPEWRLNRGNLFDVQRAKEPVE